MNRGFVLTPSASDDVLQIWEYMADDDSEIAADRVLARIYEECEKLAGMPGLGHYREDVLDREYRFWSVWNYLITTVGRLSRFR